MAYDAVFQAAYQGRPQYILQLYVRRNAVSGNSSQYAWELAALNPERRTVTWFSSPAKPWGANIAYQSWTGASALDFRAGQYSIILGSGVTDYYGHDGNGNLSFTVGGYHNTAPELFGNVGLGSPVFYADRILQPPGAPTNLWPGSNPDQITSTSMRYRFSGTTDGGSPILEWQAQRATDAGFTQNVQTITSSGTSTFTGLLPATRYYFRARGRNSVGWGAWGAQVNAVTLSGGRRWNGTAFSALTIARRFNGTSWVDLSTRKRWNGTAWVDIAN